MIILTLLISGIFAGLIQFFVDYKKLPIDTSTGGSANSFTSDIPPNWFNQLWLFIKNHWQFFAYILIGVAGAFLLPMIDTFTNLAGIEAVKTYATCMAKPEPKDCFLDGWSTLILFGYGIVFGYSAVRLIRSIGFLILGNISKQQEDLKKSLDNALQKIQELTAKLPQAPAPSSPPDGLMAAFDESTQLADSYFNNAQNETDKSTYYAGIDFINSTTLYDALHKLVADTHQNKLPYEPKLYLYPKVDRYDDGLLRSVYSGESFSLSTLLAMDAKVDQLRALALESLSVANFSSVDYNDQIAQVEKTLPYNCEHVVPQSWFSKNQPMKGDLHHLFTCETNCNSLRDSDPYTDFGDYGTNSASLIREDCGKSESNLFEPEINKGPVARATLYFLIRYPAVFEKSKGYIKKDIPMLVKWHQQNPVTTYELHRNQQIFLAQGNRNPLIDYPNIAEKIDFTKFFPENIPALTETANASNAEITS